MKKHLLLLSAILWLTAAQAQTPTKDPVSAGITGAFNFSQLKVKLQNSSADPDYKFEGDGMFGFWLNFPLSQRLSLEPQLLFISNRWKPSAGTPTDFNGRVNYLGIPVLLKIHAGKYVAFPVGLQLDIRTSEKPEDGPYQKGRFEALSLGATAGIEILPKARFSLFGRYVYGINHSNANNSLANRPYDTYNQNVYAGLKIKFFDFVKKKEVIPPPPPPPPDTDNDGIIDSLDKCPTVPGIEKYQGCPIPDTDKDGINDEEDKCPTVPGIAKYQGCPIPDTDGDGLHDEEDKCPTLVGPRENQGCPVIEEAVKKRVDLAAKNILFETGSARLHSKSFKGLDDVVKIMQENPTIMLDIDGHTDNVGTDEFNQTLSDNRAASVRTYIISKGIEESRIRSAGHGESKPIADNKTAAGRQQNRRVEMKLSYYQ